MKKQDDVLTSHSSGLRKRLASELKFRLLGVENLLWQIMENRVLGQRAGLCALVPVHSKGDLVIVGVAEAGVQGYTSTAATFAKEVGYEEAAKIVERINSEVLGLSFHGAARVVADSMLKEGI